MRKLSAGCVVVLLTVAGACAHVRVAPEGMGPSGIRPRRLVDSAAHWAERRAALDRQYKALVDAEIARIPGLPALLQAMTWVPAHGKEPGTYEGAVLPGLADGLLVTSGLFLQGRPAAGHRQRVGHDAIDFRRLTDRRNRRSLHVVVSPSTGRLETHVDNFSPYEGAWPALLHWVFDVLPNK